MPKQIQIFLACALAIQPWIPGHVFAQSAAPVVPAFKQRFQWSSGYGGPLLSAQFCGNPSSNQEKRAEFFSVQRDLGEGVNVRVGLSRNDPAHISVTLLFLYFDGLLRVNPQDIELHVQGADVVLKPRKVKREIYMPESSKCQQLGEWVHLEYLLEQDVSSVELRFASGTVAKRDTLQVRPFGFKRVVD